MKNPWVQQREMKEELEQLRMAVGLATTLKPNMVMRADDPVGMMQEVVRYINEQHGIRPCPDCGSPQRDMMAIKTIGQKLHSYDSPQYYRTEVPFASGLCYSVSPIISYR